MNQATLCLFIRENQNQKELLLAMKKRRFGVDKWNGTGGKFDPIQDKNLKETAIRETEEEIGVKIKELEKVAILNFYFPYQKEWNQEVHVFLVKDWTGEPKESEEMLPQWFKLEEIPYQQMWNDDQFWLPHILAGQKIKADFIFKEGEIVSEHKIEVVKNFL